MLNYYCINLNELDKNNNERDEKKKLNDQVDEVKIVRDFFISRGF